MKKKVALITAIAILLAALVACGIYFITTAPAGGSIEERMAAADAFVEEGKFKKAENTYKSIIKENPADVATSKKLSEFYLKTRDFEKAEELSEQMISNNREDFSLYEDRLRIYRESGDVTGAFSFIGSISDTELRRRCVDAVYDREASCSILMGNTPGNYANDSLIAFGGDAVFYSNPADNKRLYKYENGVNTMLYDGKVTSVNVLGDYVYFIDENEKSRIFRISTSGDEWGQVADIPVKSLMIIGGKMYFINLTDMKAYRMETDGKDLQKLSDNKTMKLYYYGAKLYTENERDMDTTLRMSLDGENEEIYLSNSAYFVTGYDNMLYFRDNTDVGIWAVSMSGGMYDRVHESRSGYINAKDGYVYFIDLENNGSIVKMDPECTEKSLLAGDDARNLALDKNYVYYFSKGEGSKLCRINTDGTNKVVLN